MIVREWEDEQLLLFRQTDHGTQCGQFAEHWGIEEVLPPEPRAAVVLATAEHDRGWKAWEDAPTVDPATGRPHQFFATPIPDHAPLYTSAIQELAREDPYAGLLASLHAARLRGRAFGDAPAMTRTGLTDLEREIVHRYLADHEQLQEQLWQELRDSDRYRAVAGQSQVLDNFRRLAAWDTLTLHVLTRPIADGLSMPVPLRDRLCPLKLRRLGDRELGLSPYPFDKSPSSLPFRPTSFRTASTRTTPI